MPIGVMDFPLLTPQQTSPLGGVLSDAIAKRLHMAETEKAEKEVPYAGLSSLAKILSQTQYAANVNPQWAAKLAGHRQIWANMSPEEKEHAVALANSPTANGGLGNSQFAPVIQHAMDIYNKQNQPSPGLFDSIKNILSGNEHPEEAPIAFPGISQQNNANPPIRKGLPTVSPNLGEQDQAAQNEAAYVAGQSGATAEGTALGTQSAAKYDQAQKDSEIALNMDQVIDSALLNHKKAFLKGPGLGKLARLGPDASQALKDTNMLAVNMANQLYGSNTTNAKDASTTSLKLNMEDPDRAFDEVGEKLKAQNDRIKWKGTFYQTMRDPSINITDPQERDQLWFDFNAKYPPYDYARHKPIYNHLGLDQDKMVKFITQERANTKALNKRIESTLKQQNKAEENEFVNNGSDEGIVEFGRDKNGKFIRK